MNGRPAGAVVRFETASVTLNTLFLAAVEAALVFVAFTDIGEIFRTVFGVAKCTGFASLFRIGGLGIVEL